MKNASASDSSKSQMLSSSLPLPASFFNVLPLPQKFTRFHHFRFHIPALNSVVFVDGAQEYFLPQGAEYPSYATELPSPLRIPGYATGHNERRFNSD